MPLCCSIAYSQRQNRAFDRFIPGKYILVFIPDELNDCIFRCISVESSLISGTEEYCANKAGEERQKTRIKKYVKNECEPLCNKMDFFETRKTDKSFITCLKSKLP